MTDYRKALEALENIESCYTYAEQASFGVVLEALEAAAKEAEAWREIEAWVADDPINRELSIDVNIPSGVVGFSWLAVASAGEQEAWSRATRLEALQAAADYCKAQRGSE